MEDYDVPGLYALESSAAVAQPGTDGSAAMSWIPGGLGLPTLRVGKPETPIPAVVSREVLDLAGVEVGDAFAVGTIDATVPVRAVAVADYFPTLDPREGPFVVMDLRTFNHYTNLHGQGLIGGSNEMWTSLDPVEGNAASVTSDFKSFGIDTGNVFVARRPGGAARGATPGQRRMGRPAHTHVPSAGTGKRIRRDALLLH